MQAPLAATVLLLELTHHADGLMVPVLLAVFGATVVARVTNAPSIYSSRITAGDAADASKKPDYDLLPAAIGP